MELTDLGNCPTGEHETDDLLNEALRLMKAADSCLLITFAEFHSLMEARRHTVDDLVELFRGKIDDPREYFERVMSCQWRNPKTRRFEDRSQCVIQYRSVVEFYQQELHYFKDATKRYRACPCGCGQPVFDRQKYASQACKQKAYRQRSETADLALASS